MQNNLFNYSQVEEIEASYGKLQYTEPQGGWSGESVRYHFQSGLRSQGCTVSITANHKYLGITYPVGYELKDYGVVVYKG